jgi:hypothetical protein
MSVGGGALQRDNYYSFDACRNIAPLLAATFQGRLSLISGVEVQRIFGNIAGGRSRQWLRSDLGTGGWAGFARNIAPDLAASICNSTADHQL